MSHRHPRERRRNDDVAAHDLLEAVVPFQEEVGGRLNEHNFKEDAFAAGEHNAGVGLAVAGLSEAVNPTGGGADQWTDGGTFTARRVDSGRDWSRIPTSATTFVEKSVITKGGPLWITASLQAVYAFDASNQVSSSSVRKPGCQWAIRVDGVVLDLGGCGEDVPFHGTFGFRMPCQAMVVEGLVPLDPGTHLVEVVCMFTPDGSYVQEVVEVYSHDLIVRELRG